jgi:hypothetical protein
MFTQKRICRSLWILLGSPGSRLPEDIHSVDTMKGTSVNASLQYAAFNLGCAGYDLIWRLQRTLEDGSHLAERRLEVEDSLKYLKEPLSQIESALRILATSNKATACIEAMHASLPGLQSRVIKFLSPADWENSEWKPIAEQVQALDDMRSDQPDDENLWQKYQEFLSNTASKILHGFPESLTSLEVMADDLRPFFVLARRLSELPDEVNQERRGDLSVISQLYPYVQGTLNLELRSLFEACCTIVPVFPEHLDDENLENDLQKIRQDVRERLKSLSLVEHSPKSPVEGEFTGKTGPDGQQVAATAGVATAETDGGSGVELSKTTNPQQEPKGSPIPDDQLRETKDGLLTYRKIPEGIEINGVEVKVASDSEILLWHYLELPTAVVYQEYKDLIKIVDPNDKRTLDNNNAKNFVYDLREALRVAFNLGKDFPLVLREGGGPARFKLEKSMLKKKRPGLDHDGEESKSV